jgi:hypothetical protein
MHVGAHSLGPMWQIHVIVLYLLTFKNVNLRELLVSIKGILKFPPLYSSRKSLNIWWVVLGIAYIIGPGQSTGVWEERSIHDRQSHAHGKCCEWPMWYRISGEIDSIVTMRCERRASYALKLGLLSHRSRTSRVSNSTLNLRANGNFIQEPADNLQHTI